MYNRVHPFRLADINSASAAGKVAKANGGKEVNNGWSQYGPRIVTGTCEVWYPWVTGTGMGWRSSTHRFTRADL
jgi:hypothetical protein